MSHGAADFVAKPYRPQILLHRIANILHLRETAAIINQFQYDRLTGLYTKEFFFTAGCGSFSHRIRTKSMI